VTDPRTYTRTVKPVAPWLLAAGSGLALALALPGAGLAPLVLVFPGLLLEALHRYGGGWRPWLLGLTAGLVHWLVATNWVLPVMRDYGGLPLIAATISLLGMAVLLAVCWAVAVGLVGWMPGELRVWGLPLVWMAVDAWRQFWPYRFPWNPPASAFADWPGLLTSLPVWGATGLGWAALTIGAGLWGLVRRPSRPSGQAAVVAAVGLTVLFGFLAPGAELGGEPVRVAVIQPGTSLEEKWDPSQWQEMEQRVWQLTERAAAEGAAVVLWPESAMPYRIAGDDVYRGMLTEAARRLGIRIVLNAVGGSGETGYTNSAYVVDSTGVAAQRYDKVRLVPFGEFVPWWARLAFTESLVREVGRFTPGQAPRVLDVGVPTGMAICYEVIFSDLIAAEVRSGAVLLATLTNDGWYGYSWAPRQHFAQVALRSAESRRWFARAALTGISGFVDPYGHVRARLDVGATGLLVVDVVPGTQLTPRVQWGDWWLAVSAVGGLLLLVVASRTGRS
jgi:apolipoprotein N-acyltransferase